MPEEIIVIRVDFDLIIGIIIAIKVSGMINCKSKNSGKSLPNQTPNNVEICQDKNNFASEIMCKGGQRFGRIYVYA